MASFLQWGVQTYAVEWLPLGGHFGAVETVIPVWRIRFCMKLPFV